MRKQLLSLAVLLMISPAGLVRPAAGAKAPDPRAAGRFPVGVTTTVFIDGSRTDAVTGEPRTLVTEVWYPAADEAAGKPKTKYSDFVPGGVSPALAQMIKMAYGMSVDEIDKMYWTSAVRDARPREGRFPLVVFSHGNGGTRFQNTFWCDYLASHGYIVVSADHTGNARATVINGKVVLFRNDQREQSAKDRPIDVVFLLDKMIEWDRGADKRFAGRIDTERAAITGMSFGSYTAMIAADREPRFKAVIGMSGAPESHTNLRVPSLYMLGVEDRTIGERGNQRIRDNFEQHAGPAFLLVMKNGGHYSFTDMFKLNKSFGDGVGQGKRGGSGEPFAYTDMETTYQTINAYSVAFLGYYLKGQKEYGEFLGANHWPEITEWRVKNAALGGKQEKAAKK